MAQTKHQQLAKEMQLLAKKTRKNNISPKFASSPARPSNCRYVTKNVMECLRPLKTMVKTCYCVLFYFDQKFRDFGLLGFLHRGTFIEIVEKKQLDKSSEKKINIFTTWIALINYLEIDLTRSLHDLQMDLCDLPFETNPIKKIKKESVQNSLFYQTQTIARHEKQKPFIKMEYEKQKKQMEDNLLKDALPIWEDSKKIFQTPPSEKSDPDAVIEVAANPRNLDLVSFAPLQEESISVAYEKVMESICNREDQHRYILRKIYKEELEKAIFNDVIINKLFKKSPLIRFEESFLKELPKKQITKEGRWESSQVVDCWTMNSLFNYFYSSFILDPQNIKAGDIAIIIILRIWIATLDKGEEVSMKDILNITSLDVNFQDRILKVGKEVFSIPHWIFLLLRCYCSKAKQTRAHRLFKSLDINGKALERAFHEASKAVLGTEVTPILPQAMSYLPHGYLEGRIPIEELKNMRQVEPLITF